MIRAKISNQGHPVTVNAALKILHEHFNEYFNYDSSRSKEEKDCMVIV